MPLHKTSRVKGFHLHATDGVIGHIDDFLIDPNWKVSYLVVDTSNWIGGRTVLISPGAVQSVDVEAQEIRVNLTRAEIERSPSVDTANIELIETLPPVLIL
jgi:PRC-barrel domain protein